MNSLTLIRGRILSSALQEVGSATREAVRGARGKLVLCSGNSSSSRPLSGPLWGQSAAIERPATGTGAKTRQTAVGPLTGAAFATSALTSFITRRIDSNITG